MKHFISIDDTSIDELQHVFDVAFELRKERQAGKTNKPILRSKTLAMIFEKPSLRTRVSFEQAMFELGGNAIVLGSAEVGIGKRETAADIGRGAQRHGPGHHGPGFRASEITRPRRI